MTPIPTDLDGHTIEELGDYLDRGMTPPNPSIDDSPGCRIALRSLRRLRAVGARLLDADAAAEPPRDDSWITSILGQIGLEARAGRDIPLADSTTDARLSITEGAVRGVVRAAGDEIDGVLIGRCRLDGDVTVPGSPIVVVIEVSVLWGLNIPRAVDQLRVAVGAALRRHTDLRVTAIDVIVRDVTVPDPTAGAVDNPTAGAAADSEGGLE